MKCRVPSSRRTILAVSVQLALLSFAGMAHAGEDTTLAAIDVHAAATGEVANGPVQGYVAKRSASATKTDTAIAETAQSISVVTRDEIKARGASTLQEALRYTPGVNASDDDARYDLISIRGMATFKYRDGLRAVAMGNFADTTFDINGLERIEVLKGPASVLYGQSAPGGIVNQVSKRPSLDAVNEVTLTAGSFDRLQGAIDVGGAVNSDKTVLFRLNAMLRDSGVKVDHAKDNRRFLAPSLSFQLAERTKLTLLADRLEVRTTPGNFGLANFLARPYALGKVPKSLFYGEPDFDRYNRDETSVAALFEHGFGDWKLSSSIRKASSKLDYRHIYIDAVRDDGRTMDRGALGYAADTDTLLMDTNLQGKFQTGAIAHTALFGVDYQHADHTQDYARLGATGPLDMYAPVYGGPTRLEEPGRETQEIRQLGWYAQDQMRLASLLANLGMRHDKARTKSAGGGERFDADDGKNSYNAGLLYILPGGVSPYASFANSFNPVMGLGHDGQPFKPESAKQLEAGVKYQPPGYNALFTVAVFQLRNQNVLTQDGAHPGYSVQTGEVQTRGLEFEAKTSLGRQWDLSAAYSLYDSKVTKSNDPTELNTRPAGTSRHTASVWADYRFAGAALKGWGAGLGVRVQSQAADFYWAGQHPDAGFAMLDAAVHYQTGPFSFRLFASNLLDKESTALGMRSYGSARKANATASYIW